MRSEEFKDEVEALPLIGPITLDSKSCVVAAHSVFIDAGVSIGEDFREYTCPYRLESLASRVKLEGRVNSYHLPLIFGEKVYKLRVAAKPLPDNQLLMVFTASERYLEGIPSASVFRWLNIAGELEKITSGVMGNMLLISVGDRIQKELLWQKT